MSRRFLSFLLDDDRVPEPDDLLGALPDEDEPEMPLPTPEELQAEPDIRAALDAAEGIAELVV